MNHRESSLSYFNLIMTYKLTPTFVAVCIHKSSFWEINGEVLRKSNVVCISG